MCSIFVGAQYIVGLSLGNCVFSIVWRNYVNYLGFLWRKSKVNLINRIVSMKIYGDSVESGTFHGDFIGKISLDIVWGFDGENMEIKLLDHLHINFTIKSP